MSGEESERTNMVRYSGWSGIVRILVCATVYLTSALPVMATQPGLSGQVSRIRCMLPGRHGKPVKTMPDGVRIPAVFRTPVQFGEIAPHPETGEGMTFAAPRPALAEANAECEPFVPHRIPDARVSMRDEMVAATDFDNGRIRAMAIRDRSDRMRIHGFVRIPTVWGVRFAPPEHIRSAPIMLAEAVNRYTDIEASMDGHLMLTDRRLFSTPFLYITAGENFDLTRQESKRLGEYLRSGGFVFVENSTFEKEYYTEEFIEYAYGQGGTSLKRMLRDAIGCHARFEPIPRTHLLFRCLFDFTDGPPQGNEVRIIYSSTVQSMRIYPNNAKIPDSVYYLEGVFLEGRLVAIYSEKGYGMKWSADVKENSSPQMRFAANLVVYALTREGGITDRVMERFKDIQ